jgi:hypothetical protein
MSTAGQDLLAQVTDAVWSLLERYRSAAAGVLAGLGPEPGLGGTVLDGRLLQAIRPDAIASGDPAVAVLISAVKSLVPNPDVPNLPVTLHGFDPGGGQPRGVALVVVTPAPPTTIVAALTGAGPTGLAMEIAAIGAGPFGPVHLSLLGDWSIDVSGDTAGGGRLQFARNGPPQVLDAAAPIKVKWSVTRGGVALPSVVGPADGPHLLLSDVNVDVGTGLDAGGLPTISVGVATPRAQLSVGGDIVEALLDDEMNVAMDLALDATPDSGLTFRGGGVRATVPANVDLPVIEVHAIEAGLDARGTGLGLTFGVAFTGGLPAVPISFAVDGVGAVFPIDIGSGDLGINPAGVRPALPTGLGVGLEVPIVSGGGFLATTGPGAYGGVLDLSLIEVSVQAFGLLQLPVDGMPLAFVAIISVAFPPPGIQLGFGFSLNAVGGIVAINRRLDQPALLQAVIDGSAEQILFPVDPVSHAPAIIATLGHIFPVDGGHIVVGPMFQIGWGGRILTLSVAVVVHMPSPMELVIIGRLTLALPDPVVPLIKLQATVVGTFDLSPNPGFTLLASLNGSSIVGLPLHGDLLFMVRSGQDAAFVLSIGGFHPRYVRPVGVPQLARVSIDLVPPGFPGLRSETYVAVTSNSVQFGASVELCAEVAGCGLHGWLAYDVLFQWDPVFSFSAHCSAGIAVEVFGETLMGISFDLVVEGPAPWHIHGTGSITLLFFSASLDFDVHWGDAPPALPPPPDLAPVLAAAFAARTAWIAAPPADDRSMVSISASARKQSSGGQVVDPLGGLVGRQRAVPFAIQISRYQNVPIPPQTWTMAAAEITTGVAADLGVPTDDEFPPGAFLDLPEDQKLTRPAFERFTSGAALTPQAVLSSDLRPVNTDFEVILVPEIRLGVPVGLVFVHAFAESLLAIGDPHASNALWTPPNVSPVVVLGSQPMAAASTASLQEQAVTGAPKTFTEIQQAAEKQFGRLGPAFAVQIVERWETAA